MTEELRLLHAQAAELVQNLAEKCVQANPNGWGYVQVLQDFAELMDRGAQLLNEQPNN